MDTCFHVPYLIWDSCPEETKLFFEKNRDNKIFETASLALRAQTPNSNHRLVIPLDIKTAGQGFYFVCQKVFLIGKELLILSKVEGRPSGDIKVGRIREKFFLRLPSEMKQGNHYEFIHFLLTKDAEMFEEVNGLDDMVVCAINDEEEFYHHLNLCAQISNYIPLLKEKIVRKKFRLEAKTFVKEAPQPKHSGKLIKRLFSFRQIPIGD